MAIIRLGQISKEMMLPFIAPILCFFDTFCRSFLDAKWSDHKMLCVFFHSLGKVFFGFILCVISLFIRPGRKHKTTTDTNERLIKHKYAFLQAPNAYSIPSSAYIMIVLCSLLMTIALILIYYFSWPFIYEITTLTIIVSQLLFSSFLCWLLLSYTYAKHHYYAFCAVIIGYVLILSTSYCNIMGIASNYPVANIFLYILGYFLFSFSEVIEKWLMLNNFIHPSILLLIDGLICLSVSLGFIWLLSNYQCIGKFALFELCSPQYQSKTIESFAMFIELFHDLKNFGLFIGFMLLNGGYHTVILYTIYRYSPIHRSISDFISDCLYAFIFELISLMTSTSDSIMLLIINIIGYVIILFSILVYNEIIICSFWNLDYNTKEEISKRDLINFKSMHDDLVKIATNQANSITDDSDATVTVSVSDDMNN